VYAGQFYSIIVIMFLIFFLIFILFFTVFQNILVAGISLLFVLIWLVIYHFISRKKILSRQMIFFVFAAFVLAGVVFVIKEVRYYGTIEMWKNWKIENGKTFIGNGSIVDISSQWKYAFVYRNDEYLLYSKKQHSIGDQLWLVGNITPLATSKIEGWWYRTISSWTFAVPLFSGSFDFAKWMKMKWWKGTIYETNSIALTSFSSTLHHSHESENQAEDDNGIWFIQSMKRSIQEKVVEAYGENRISGLILWMLIGDKSEIPEMEYQQFIDSGLVHLIAVSGWNILMIVVFLQFLLFFLPFYLRIFVILSTIIWYSFICGLDSSVFRAMLMGGLSMVALFRGREINIRRLMSISVILMLIINPYFLVYDTGFLLSYSALIGIVYFDTLKKEKNENVDPGQIPATKLNTGMRGRNDGRVRKWLQYIYKTYISPSIWASIGIFPVIIFFMGQINLVSILGNLLVLPIVPFVMIYGFVSIWLYSWLGWWWLLWIEEILVRYIYKISELLANYWVFFQVSWLRIKYLIFLGFLLWFVWWRIGRDKK